MSERYQIVSADANLDSKELATFLAKDGQLLLPMLDLIEQAQCAIDDLVDVMGRAPPPPGFFEASLGGQASVVLTSGIGWLQ